VPKFPKSEQKGKTSNMHDSESSGYSSSDYSDSSDEDQTIVKETKEVIDIDQHKIPLTKEQQRALHHQQIS